MAAYNAKKVDLTGCSLEQVLYIIDKGLPVIADDRCQSCDPADRI